MKSEVTAFNCGVEPLLEKIISDKADEILAFRSPPRLRQRIEELAGKSSEGRLTPRERAEYAGYVRANKFIAILQRKARQLAGE
jgi:hypothetical protein